MKQPANLGNVTERPPLAKAVQYRYAKSGNTNSRYATPGTEVVYGQPVNTNEHSKEQLQTWLVTGFIEEGPAFRLTVQPVSGYRDYVIETKVFENGRVESREVDVSVARREKLYKLPWPFGE